MARPCARAATAWRAPATASPWPSDELIVFERGVVGAEERALYAVGPEGGEPRLVTQAGGYPHWSADGGTLAFGACLDPPDCTTATALLERATGEVRGLPMPDPTLFTGCLVWAPSGRELAPPLDLHERAVLVLPHLRLLALHVLAAFSWIAALVVYSVVIVAGWRLTVPSDVVRMFRVSRVGDALIAVGMLGMVVTLSPFASEGDPSLEAEVAVTFQDATIAESSGSGGGDNSGSGSSNSGSGSGSSGSGSGSLVSSAAAPSVLASASSLAASLPASSGAFASAASASSLAASNASSRFAVPESPRTRWPSSPTAESGALSSLAAACAASPALGAGEAAQPQGEDGL